MKQRQRSNSITRKLYNIIITTALITMIIVSFPVIIVFSAIIKDNAIADKKNLMHEIMNQVDFNIASISAECRRIQYDGELGRLLDRYRKGENVKNGIDIRLNALIAPLGNFYRNVLIVTEQGDLFTSITRISDGDLAALEIKDFASSDNYYLTRPFYYYDGLNNRQSGLSYIRDFTASSGVRGRMIINVDFSAFISIFKSVEQAVDHYQWIGYDNKPIYPADSTEPLLALDKITQASLSSGADYDAVIENGGVHNILIFSKASGLILATQVSQAKLLEQYNWFIFYYILSILLLVVVILAAALPMMRRQLKPLQQLSAMMKTFSAGQMLLESDIYTNDEIEELSNSFNAMTRQLRFYIQKTLENEKDKERMRYSLLISQINPHFIYNTLNTITYLVRQNRSSDIVAVNSALIKILRDSLRIDSVQIFDAVEQEIEVVKQYIIIQQYRYGSDFSVNWQVDADVLHLAIPKSLLQPLVENALFHGLLPCESENFKGVINISIQAADDKILVKVADNGAGMDESSLADARRWLKMGAGIRGKHVGLKNIIGRINYLYGPLESGSRLQIESQPQQGTTVTILLDRDQQNQPDENVFRFE
ncbi:MAG TPA: hypothetical protein DCM45_05570 [Clostridiales bacterium]|nr:hypothetical protein [Clostridiales bacterium]